MATMICTHCKGVAGTLPVMKETSRTNMVDTDKTEITTIYPAEVEAAVAESNEIVTYTCPYCGYSETVTTVFTDAMIGVEPAALQYS